MRRVRTIFVPSLLFCTLDCEVSQSQCRNTYTNYVIYTELQNIYSGALMISALKSEDRQQYKQTFNLNLNMHSHHVTSDVIGCDRSLLMMIHSS